MNTIVNSTTTKTSANLNHAATGEDFWNQAEFNRFGIMPLLLVIIGCVGGAAASFGGHGDAIRLSIAAFPTVIALSAMLAMAPMRTIVTTSVIAIIIDLLLLAF